MSQKLPLLFLLVFVKIFLNAPACLSADTAGFGESRVDPNWDALLSQMTLKEKVGQLFMVSGKWRWMQSEKFLKSYNIGNAFLGYVEVNDLTPPQVAKLTGKLQSWAKKYNRGIPLLIATDQEGGAVNRLRRGFVTYPNQDYVGRHFRSETAEAIAYHTGAQMKAVGVNVNFTPVLDVNTNPRSHIARYGRSFSSDSQRVAELGLAYLKGFRRAGIVGTAKHFPGYGAVAPDPHQKFTVLPKDLDQLKKSELIPYFNVITREAVDLIMTAHLYLPKIEKDKTLPATISPTLLTEQLRREMGYRGVIVTDDLNMGSIARQMPIESIATKYIKAGGDILLFVGNETAQVKAWQAIYKAVKKGYLSEERINESVRRILSLKYKYNLFKENQ